MSRWSPTRCARAGRAARDAELIDLTKISTRDHFQQRKLVRQLEDLVDQIAKKLQPIYEHEFRDVAENERTAALLAVVDALQAADLTDETLFAVDVNARKLARLVRERVPVRRVGLAEPAERLYDAVLDESCMTLVQVVKQLPAFEPRALAELLERFSQVVEGIAEVLHRLPRTTLNAPAGGEHDEEFRARYLAHVSETLDELEQFGIDVRRYKPRTLVSAAYLSLQVSTDPARRGRSDRPEELWFTEGRRTVTDPAQRPAVRKWLHGLLAQYPQLRMVVTARPGAADPRWLVAEKFAPVRVINPWSVAREHGVHSPTVEISAP